MEYKRIIEGEPIVFINVDEDDALEEVGLAAKDEDGNTIWAPGKAEKPGRYVLMRMEESYE